jgi:uncharacterized protein YcbK (DUF882 family)
MADLNGDDPGSTGLSRRRLFVFGAAAAAGLIAMPGIVRASNRIAPAPPRVLDVVNTNTGESLRGVAYWADGRYVPDALTALDRLMRDHRSGEIHPIDPRLYDRLREVAQRMGHRGEIHLLSGYRTPETNDVMYEASPGNVAVNSFHSSGRALDLRIPGQSTRNVYRAAMTGQLGGVGFYPRANFVHLDVGPLRTWTDRPTVQSRRRATPVRAEVQPAAKGRPQPAKPAQKATSTRRETPSPVRPTNR